MVNPGLVQGQVANCACGTELAGYGIGRLVFLRQGLERIVQ